jgi:transposase
MPQRQPLTEIAGNIRAKKELSNGAKGVIYGRALAGESVREIAEAEHVPKSTVDDILRRTSVRGTVVNTHRAGHPKLHSARNDRAIVRAAQRALKATY